MLYGLWSLDKHMSILFEAQYFDPTFPALSTTREMTLDLCSQLKDEAVALVDVFAPPDFILNSCLGFSDGKVYEHIFDALTHSKGSFERPEWLLDTFKGKDTDLTSVEVDAIRAKL
jgi:acyl-CoA oxidase